MNENQFTQITQDGWTIIQILRAVKTMVIGVFIMSIIIVILMLVGLQDALAFQCNQQWAKANLVIKFDHTNVRQTSKKNKHCGAVHLRPSICVKPRRIKFGV